jgi:hypothetical protein
MSLVVSIIQINILIKIQTPIAYKIKFYNKINYPISKILA